MLMEGLNAKELIQVCWDIENKETRKREISGLLEAMKELQLSKGLILTEDFEGKEKIGGKVIIYQPLWKWLLDF